MGGPKEGVMSIADFLRARNVPDRPFREAEMREEILFGLADQVREGTYSPMALKYAADDALSLHEHQPAAWYALASMHLAAGMIDEGCDDLDAMLADSRYVVTRHTPFLGVYGLALLARRAALLEADHFFTVDALEEHMRQHVWADPLGRRYLRELRRRRFATIGQANV